jgi:hypothetical protein
VKLHIGAYADIHSACSRGADKSFPWLGKLQARSMDAASMRKRLTAGGVVIRFQSDLRRIGARPSKIIKLQDIFERRSIAHFFLGTP